MTQICNFIFLFNLIFVFTNQNQNNLNNPKDIKRHSCGSGNNNYEIKKVNFNSQKDSIKRKLENEEEENYKPINIYYDMTYLNQQKMNSSQGIIQKINMIDKSMLRCINIFKKLINIKQPLNGPIKIKSEQDLKEWKFTSYKINQDLMPNSNGILCDLVILIRFKNENEDKKYDLPDASPVYIDEYTKRPILGILIINDEFEIKKNSQDYLEYLLLHGITHILGFYYDLFSSFPGQLSNTILIEKETRTNKEKYKIKTQKVLEFAKKYFNCNKITGVELENNEQNKKSSHWEGRILLGEYMNSEPYTPEQVISEFTLALLEDSGWYKVNYYTGGLMKFGKNKGCDFINKDCLTYKSFVYNVNFKNEFCDPSINWVPSCSSGRQSRSYCSTELNDIDPDFQRFGNYKGRVNTDYCFVNDFYPPEENLVHYVGNCKKGEGEYGSNILYNDNIKESNSKMPESFGEKYGDNSFCVLSSVIPNMKSNKNNQIYNKYLDVIHSMCYPMFCTEKTLTIQINNQYIVCPREGGKIELMGDYIGELFCPDYNLICTGTIPCNDMFDCVEKESLAKNDTYEYDYIIKTSQHLPDLIRADIDEGYELSENGGKCPQNCQQCLENKKCIKCRSNYKLIGVNKNDNNPILCADIDISELKQYYKDSEDNTYYKCPNYCLNCENGGLCSICDNIHQLNSEKNICEEKVENCEKYNLNNEDCLSCKENYFFINDDRKHCYNNLENINKYYSSNNNTIYYSCYYGVLNCEECLNKTICTKCKDNYFFINEERSICYNQIDKKKYYPEQNNTVYYSCNHNLPFCEECSSKNECTKCKNGYFFINEDRTKCYNEIDKNKFYSENNETVYYLCNYNLPNCEECLNKNECSKCKNGYFFINDDKTKCFNNIDERKYFSENNGTMFYLCSNNLPNCEECLNKKECSKCKSGYYFVNEDRTQCFNNVEKNKYYLEHNGTVYYSCEKNLPNCEECLNKNECIKCKSKFFFINNDRTQCYNKLDDKNKYYINEDKTIYYSCNTSIPNCETCLNKNECTKCIDNYFFINEDRTKCYNKIDNKKYYVDEDGKAYYLCSYNLNNCLECESKTKCLLCEDNYYLSGKNYLCFPISTINFNQCQIVYSNIEEKKEIFNNKEYLISLINNYINEYNDINYIIKHYSNIHNNYTISIFKSSICTKLLIQSGFYYLDTNDILKKVNLDFLYNNDNYIHCFITYGFQNYFILYNQEINSFLNLSYLYDNIYYNISNNYTYKINNLLGKEISNSISNKNINVFDSKELIFKSICQNFTIGGIDIPYKYRLNKLYLGKISKELICTSDKCKIKSYDINSSIGECECNINEEIDYLLSQPENLFLDNYPNSSNFMDSFKVFTCFNKNYKILSNVGLNISIIFIIIHILCISFYFILNKKIYGFNEIGNPPHKKKGMIIEDDLEESDKNDNENYNYTEKESYCDSYNYDEEKRTQAKDIVYDDTTNNNIFKKGIQKNEENKNNENIENKNNNLNNFNYIKSGIEINSDTNEDQNISDLMIKNTNTNYKYETENEKNNFSEDLYPEGKEITIIRKKKKNRSIKNGLKSSENNELIDINNNNNMQEELFDKNNSIVKINRIKKKNLRNTDYINNSNKKKETEEEKIGLSPIKIKNDISIKKNSNQSQSDAKLNMSFNTNMPEDNKEKELVIEREYEKLYDKDFKNFHKEISERFSLKTNSNNSNSNINNNASKSNYVTKQNKKFLILFNLEEENKKNSKVDLNISTVDYLPFDEVQLNERRSFLNLFWHVLSLKQPIINIFSFIDYFNIAHTYIPLAIKLNKFCFLIILNMFINAMNLSQLYLYKKYESFNDKYNIQENDIKIKINEIIKYAMKNGILQAIISFAICLVIYYLIEYIFFNYGRKINNLSFEENVHINKLNNKIIELMKSIKKKIIIYICLSSILIILSSIYLINFAFINPGGIFDCFFISIVTFIFLQAFPIFESLLICLLRYYSIKKRKRKLYELSQLLF